LFFLHFCLKFDILSFTIPKFSFWNAMNFIHSRVLNLKPVFLMIFITPPPPARGGGTFTSLSARGSGVWTFTPPPLAGGGRGHTHELSALRASFWFQCISWSPDYSPDNQEQA
jgi:hypothetical protein